MPLLRSFDFVCYEFYKHAAPSGAKTLFSPASAEAEGDSNLAGHNALSRLVPSKESRTAVMDPLEDQEIKEVHAAQHEQYEADLIGQSFDSLLRICDNSTDF